MSESERAEKLKAIQLELFQIKQVYVQKRKELKRQLVLIRGRGMKRCRDCSEVMEVDQFPLDPRYSDARYPYCYECKNARNLKRKGSASAA